MEYIYISTNGRKIGYQMFTYIKKVSPLTKPLYTLLPGTPVQLSTISTFLKKQPATLQLMCAYYFVQRFPLQSLARYSFIKLSEFQQCRVDELAKGVTWQQRVRTQVLLSKNAKFLSMRRCANKYIFIGINYLRCYPLADCYDIKHDIPKGGRNYRRARVDAKYQLYMAARGKQNLV